MKCYKLIVLSKTFKIRPAVDTIYIDIIIPYVLLLDISHNESSEEDFLIDQLLSNLNADRESNFIQQQPITSHDSNLDLPDLSELPLEDFADIEALLDDGVMVNKINQIASNETTYINIDDILDGTSGQSSPSSFGQDDQEYNALLDLMFDSDFMQGFATNSNTPVDVLKTSDASCLSETTEVIGSSLLSTSSSDNVVIAKTGSKRTVSDVTECTTTVKRVKGDDEDEDDEFLYVRKANETEKDMIRRVKNNVASRVTRAKRKDRHSELFKKQTEFERSNAELRIKIELMQKEADTLRQILVAKLSSTSSN